MVFKNLNTLGHLIGSIKLIYPLLSNFSIFYSIPPSTVVSNNSDVEGLISASTVKHILISYLSSRE